MNLDKSLNSPESTEESKISIGDTSNYDLLVFSLVDKEKKSNFQELYKDKKVRADLELQIHHITPKHSQGSEDASNKVICTKQDHILAHKCRFETYKDYNDQSAYLFMESQTKEGDLARSKAIQQKHRENQTGFFNPELQRSLGKRPKNFYFLRENLDKAKEWSALAKGVPKNTSEKAKDNYFNRGVFVGTNYGSKGGTAHQHPEVKEALTKTLKWKHQSGKQVITSGDIKTLENIKIELNKAVPDSVKYANALGQLIRKEAKNRYGWVLEE